MNDNNLNFFNNNQNIYSFINIFKMCISFSFTDINDYNNFIDNNKLHYFTKNVLYFYSIKVIKFLLLVILVYRFMIYKISGIKKEEEYYILIMVSNAIIYTIWYLFNLKYIYIKIILNGDVEYYYAVYNLFHNNNNDIEPSSLI